MTRSGHGSGRSFRAVRSVWTSITGTGRCWRVRAVVLLTDRRLSGHPTSLTQGVVDAVKLTGLQRAVLTIWRKLAEIRRQLDEMRVESTPGVTPGRRIRPDHVGTNRVRPEQTRMTPEQSVMDGSAATRPETTRRSSPARPALKLGTYNGTTPPLATFLAKFENCSDYYGWDDRAPLSSSRMFGG